MSSQSRVLDDVLDGDGDGDGDGGGDGGGDGVETTRASRPRARTGTRPTRNSASRSAPRPRRRRRRDDDGARDPSPRVRVQDATNVSPVTPRRWRCDTFVASRLPAARLGVTRHAIAPTRLDGIRRRDGTRVNGTRRDDDDDDDDRTTTTTMVKHSTRASATGAGVEMDEHTPMLQGAKTTMTTTTWALTPRRALAAIGGACACAVAVVGARAAIGGSFGASAAARRTVEFSVDVGCIPPGVMENAPIKGFFDTQVTKVTMQRKGTPPGEFGGDMGAGAGVELTRSGFSTIFKGTATVSADEEFGFAATNANGDTIFELGRNRRLPKTGDLIEDSCSTAVEAGGGVYHNRKFPAGMTPRADGVYEYKARWAGCLGVCPQTVKLIATVGPALGDADNVYGIEESKAATDAWRKYKGHFTMVSAGESNTWGLDTNTGKLMITDNLDLNPYDASNWRTVNNDAKHLSYPSDGPAIDMDVGYGVVYGVTKNQNAGGGRIWMRSSNGNDNWVQAGVYETSRLVQVTSGRTYLWGTNLMGNVFYCANPCRPGSHWEYGVLDNIKQMEVGDVQIYAIHNNGRTIYVRNENAIGGWSTINVPAAFSSTDIVNQVAVGETSLWLLDGQGKLYQCSLPCAGGGAFTLIPSAPANIISIDAGKVVR